MKTKSIKALAPIKGCFINEIIFAEIGGQTNPEFEKELVPDAPGAPQISLVISLEEESCTRGAAL